MKDEIFDENKKEIENKNKNIKFCVLKNHEQEDLFKIEDKINENSVNEEIENEEYELLKHKRKNENNENVSIIISHSGFNSGRWSEEEHKKFLEAICIYGNEWKKVQYYIETRNSTQARSHAQKFFLRLKKSLKYSDKKNDVINGLIGSGKFFSNLTSKGKELENGKCLIIL
jgi:SHAQKYF class myb-like DNA-binding protein